LTYALPLLHHLKTQENEGYPVTAIATPRAVIMVPTRELGEQVAKVFKLFTHGTRLRVRSALGGMTMEQARRNVALPFEILLATPGRLRQLMELDLIHLNAVQVLIFDEADQMLDQGFLPDSDEIASACPKDIQLALFSATVSPSVQNLMNMLFADAEVIRSSGSGKVVKTLTTQNRTVQDGKRWPLFERILQERTEGGTLIFTNTRDQCDKLAAEITAKGYLCAIYRGEMDKNERRANLKKFRDGKIDILVSTDLAARGLDLEHVGRVINFHLPREKENYLHRVGRTARAGRTGLVINLVTERDAPLMAELEGKKPVKMMPRTVRKETPPVSARAGSTRKAPGASRSFGDRKGPAKKSDDADLMTKPARPKPTAAKPMRRFKK
ncbi:MAG: DEAD/DEAH box helicase, partial [Proteobacteria bacterium]